MLKNLFKRNRTTLLLVFLGFLFYVKFGYDLNRNDFIDFDIEIFTGKKSFTVYTMDFTKKYIDINADYRS